MIECGPWTLAALHIPTGTQTQRNVPSTEFEDRAHFLEYIAWLNRQNPGKWQYWEQFPGELPPEVPAKFDSPFPNLHVREVIKNACAYIADWQTASTHKPETNDAWTLGYMRGTLDMLARSDDPAAIDWVKALSSLIDHGGAGYVNKLVRSVNGAG